MPDQPAIFITLEGLRGCGKSTIAPLLADRLGGRHLPTVPEEFGDARELLDRASSNVEARAHLFIAAVFVTADRARTLLSSGVPVIVDSFLARTLANHRAYGARIEPALPLHWVEPTAIYLTCSNNERAERLEARTKSLTHWDALAEKRQALIEQEYARFAMHRIDTTGRRPHETVEDILDAVGHG